MKNNITNIFVIDSANESKATIEKFNGRTIAIIIGNGSKKDYINCYFKVSKAGATTICLEEDNKIVVIESLDPYYKEGDVIDINLSDLSSYKEDKLFPAMFRPRSHVDGAEFAPKNWNKKSLYLNISFSRDCWRTSLYCHFKNKWGDILKTNNKIFIGGKEVKQDFRGEFFISENELVESNFNIEVERDGVREKYIYIGDYEYINAIPCVTTNDTFYCEYHQRRESIKRRRPDGHLCWQSGGLFVSRYLIQSERDYEFPELILKVFSKFFGKDIYTKEELIRLIDIYNQGKIGKSYIELVYENMRQYDLIYYDNYVKSLIKFDLSEFFINRSIAIEISHPDSYLRSHLYYVKDGKVTKISHNGTDYDYVIVPPDELKSNEDNPFIKILKEITK